MPRIRKIEKCLKDIRAVDADTCITAWNIRRLIMNGDIQSWKSGNRNLVDVDQVELYFGMITPTTMNGGDSNDYDTLQDDALRVPVIYRNKKGVKDDESKES